MTAADKPKPPFPSDAAMSIKDGAPVYFAWQTWCHDKDSGDEYCIVAKNKSAVIRAMIRCGFDIDLVDPEKITPVAMLHPQAVTTKSAGRFSPLDFETAETVEKNVKAAKSSPPKKAPPPSVDDEDDLI